MEKHTIVNSTYQKFRDLFTFDPEKGGLHNLLWQILINGLHGDKVIVFYVDALSNELILADEKGGFWKTHIHFKEKMTFDECLLISKELNQLIFNLEEDKVDKIINDSMQLNIQNLSSI